MRPREINSSRESRVSSSPLPLAVLTVSKSNDRPTTAAAARICPAVSPTVPRRVLRRSCTPPGSVQVSSPRSSSPFSTAARYSVRKSGSPSVSSLSRGPSGAASGTAFPTNSSTDSGLNLFRVRAVAVPDLLLSASSSRRR
jgi:hypothetical protein